MDSFHPIIEDSICASRQQIKRTTAATVCLLMYDRYKLELIIIIVYESMLRHLLHHRRPWKTRHRWCLSRSNWLQHFPVPISRRRMRNSLNFVFQNCSDRNWIITIFFHHERMLIAGYKGNCPTFEDLSIVTYHNCPFKILTYQHTFPCLWEWCAYLPNSRLPRNFKEWICAFFRVGTNRQCSLMPAAFYAQKKAIKSERHTPSRKKAKAKNLPAAIADSHDQRHPIKHCIDCFYYSLWNTIYWKRKRSTMVRLSVSIELIGVKKEEFHSAKSIGGIIIYSHSIQSIPFDSVPFHWKTNISTSIYSTKFVRPAQDLTIQRKRIGMWSRHRDKW